MCQIEFDIKKEKKEMEPYSLYCVCPVCNALGGVDLYQKKNYKNHSIKYIGKIASISYYGKYIDGPHFKRTCFNCGYEWPQSIIEEK